MKKYEFRQVSNMVFLMDETETVWKAWHTWEFTERKMKNAMKSIQKNFGYEIEFVKTF